MLLRWSPIFALLLSLLLSACGQKGPLYLPDQPMERTSHTHNGASAPAEATVETEEGTSAGETPLAEGEAEAAAEAASGAEAAPEPNQEADAP